MEKKTKLTISGSAKKSIKNIEIAKTQDSECGDGTTTATVIAEALIKEVNIKENDATKAKDLFISTQKVLDKLANKKVLPKNAVARQKSRLIKSIKKLG